MICEKCINDNTELCEKCRNNPKYSNLRNYYQDYKPSCPFGYDDCICDPAYIKSNYPDWYKEMWGDMSIEEVSRKKCLVYYKEDDRYCPSYDDEDK